MPGENKKNAESLGDTCMWASVCANNVRACVCVYGMEAGAEPGLTE